MIFIVLQNDVPITGETAIYGLIISCMWPLFMTVFFINVMTVYSYLIQSFIRYELPVYLFKKIQISTFGKLFHK